MTDTKHLPFAGYIRVSRVAGRTGDSFISPDVQAETITRLASTHGVELAEVVEEMDASGGKSIDSRELGRLVAKVEAGEYGGIIVWKMSRFSRSLADGVTVAQRIKAAGGRIISEEMDTGSKNGGLLLGLWLGLAEDELDARREGWRNAQVRAARRGTFPGKAPIGYVKDEDGRLIPDPVFGPAVGELFQLRAKGASLATCSKHLEDTTGKRSSRAALSNMFRNRTYLGHTALGDIREDDTHEPLTDPNTFARCQHKDNRQPRDGSLASQGVLAGFVRCAGCGSVMSVTASGPKGRRTASYSCRGKRVGGDCPAPASALLDKVDELVRPQVGAYKAHGGKSLKESLNETEQFAFAMGDARKELDAYLDSVQITDVGKEDYLRGLTRRREAVEAAEAEWALAEQRADALLDAGDVDELVRDRAIARTLLESVPSGAQAGEASASSPSPSGRGHLEVAVRRPNPKSVSRAPSRGECCSPLGMGGRGRTALPATGSSGRTSSARKAQGREV